MITASRTLPLALAAAAVLSLVASCEQAPYPVGPDREAAKWDLVYQVPDHPAELTCVWADSEGAMIGGVDGKILRLNDNSWEVDRLSGNNRGSVFDIYGSSMQDVFAGTMLGVFHYDGVTWRKVGDVYAFHLCGDGAGGLFALSGDELLHFDGSEWRTLIQLPWPPTSVCANSPTSAYVGGYDPTANRGEVVHWNGSTLQSVCQPDYGVNDLLSFGSNDVFVITMASVLRYQGSLWIEQVLPEPGGELRAASGTRPGDVWVVGPHRVLHFDGTDWNAVDTGYDFGFRGVATAPDEVYLIGDVNVLKRPGAGDWESVYPHQPLSVTGVWAWSKDERLVVSGLSPRHLYLFTHGAWRQLRPPQDDDHLVWASGSDAVYVVAWDGVTNRFDGSTWTVVDTLREPARSVDVGSGTTAWVGTYGGVFRFDGTSWIMAHSLPGTDFSHISAGSDGWAAAAGWSSTQGAGIVVTTDGVQSQQYEFVSFFPLAVWMGSRDAAVVVGKQGRDERPVAMHFDGSRWQGVPMARDWTVEAVAGRSADDVFAVGGGRAYHFDGSLWREIDPPGHRANRVTLNPQGDVFVYGYDAILRLEGP